MKLHHIVPFLSRHDGMRDALVEKASREAETGRRLAMFDRQSGLYAHWYLVRRFDEESLRAERYRRPLSVMLLEVHHDREFRVQDELRDVLQHELRSSDLATHLGDGRFLCLLTETALADAAALAARIAARFPQRLAIGLACLPDDGATLEELTAFAERRSHGNWALAV